MSSNDVVRPKFDQNVIVMRHGDRRDNFDPTWVNTAARPWDPPLVDEGRARAYRTGLELRNSLGFPINRVFVSPFLRCVQTASEAVAALCTADNGGARGSPIDPSKVKVSIEYGLCEMLNDAAIRPHLVPKDGLFTFDISELETMLPAGTVDTSAEKIYSEMPKWGEAVTASRGRYEHIIQALADKYPSENLLLVTHGEGVGTSVSTFMKDADVYEVNYCAYSHLRRSVNFGDGGSYTAGNFQLLTVPHITGIGFLTQSSLADGV
ncbi:hypothetical protein RND81_02G107800 [Saponaria officinalis]|uniref:Phosphoglycerate mutase family protein n=1 Tax=Saponaria officinalis TaxID=3572 RepID=A0AAW1MVX2_SAPOF